jgi:hypothetical protein
MDICDHVCNWGSPSEVWSSGFLATDPEIRARFLALPDFLRSSGPRTGSTQRREYTRGVNGAEKYCVSSEVRTEFLNII